MSLQVYQNEVARRDGPTPQNYILKLIEFLHRRTGFKFENFQTPRHMQRLLDELSFNRVPMAVWQSLLTVVLRISNMYENINHRVRHFGAFFIDVLSWFFKRLAKMGLFKFCIFLLGYNISPVITAVIGVIAFIAEYLLDVLFNEFSKFIQSHLISAPYYRHFVTM